LSHHVSHVPSSWWIMLTEYSNPLRPLRPWYCSLRSLSLAFTLPYSPSCVIHNWSLSIQFPDAIDFSFFDQDNCYRFEWRIKWSPFSSTNKPSYDFLFLILRSQVSLITLDQLSSSSKLTAFSERRDMWSGAISLQILTRNRRKVNWDLDGDMWGEGNSGVLSSLAGHAKPLYIHPINDDWLRGRFTVIFAYQATSRHSIFCRVHCRRRKRRGCQQIGIFEVRRFFQTWFEEGNSW
jgi:hypothetical protein